METLHYNMIHQVLPKAGFKNYEEVVAKLPLYVAALKPSRSLEILYAKPLEG
jgi:hypothetical protein